MTTELVLDTLEMAIWTRGRGGAEDLEAVALALNNRPRKILGWKTPAEVFEEQLRSLQPTGVARTD